ncbi:MAG: SCO family protein [Planctomycetota bacterium]
MKTAAHIALILSLGVGVGLLVRKTRTPPRTTIPEGEFVYTNDNAREANETLTAADVANNEPSKPAADSGWLSEFELTERSGQQVASEDLLGRPYVVSFFFSTCPASCMQQNQKLRELQGEFEGRGVKFLAISVDPETDTPEVLREYAARFGADKEQWLFLTGDLTYIRQVGSMVFQTPVDKKFHTDRFILVDRQGEIEGFYNWPEKRQFEALKKSIASMLVEDP